MRTDGLALVHASEDLRDDEDFTEVLCVGKLFSPQAEHKVSLFASARFLNRKK